MFILFGRYGRVLILRLEPIETRPVRVDGLRDFSSYSAEVFVIPEIANFDGAGEAEFGQGD